MSLVLTTVTADSNASTPWFDAMGEMGHSHYYVVANEGRGVVEGLQVCWEYARSFEHPYSVLAVVHNDVEVLDPAWRDRVVAEFTDPQVAIVGFGGALGIGLPEIYKVPYSINQLQRRLYMSNQTDWQVHGTQETGARDVAVIDGFFMAIRMSFLDEVKGWSWFPFNFHCYDTCMCLMALRRGYRVRMAGVECTHHGGGTSTKAVYNDWCKVHGTTPELEHSEPHRWMFREFSDLLPLWVKEGGK